MASIDTRFRRLALGAACAVAVAAPASAADYFAGKTIELTIGADVAGGYDTYGRLVAQFLPKHIPGKPTVVVKNSPGAGSLRAGNYIATVAPKDGTAIGGLMPGAIMGPLTDEKMRSQMDPTKLIYLGSADSGSRVCATFHTSKIKTFQDAQNNKVVVGASADGGATKDFPTVLNALAGTKFDIVGGYKGTNEITLAVERGEVDGLCGFDWSSLQAQKSDWLRDKKLNILIQMASEEEPSLTALGVPEIWGFLKSDDDRKMFQLLVSQQLFGRPYVLPPGTNPEAVKILRAAFDATVKDPEYLEAAKKSRLSVNPASGEKVQGLVEKLYQTPAAVANRLQQIMDTGK
jgi:tripartite-type tricarboxylate transporter receptor subunit TctC